MTKYTKIGLASAFAVFFAYALVISPVFALSTSDNESTAGQAPATSDNGNTSAPSTSNNGNTSAPATSNNGNTSAPGTSDNGNTSAPNTSSNGNTSAPGTSNNGNTSAPGTSDNGNTSTTKPSTSDNGNTSAPGTSDNGNTSAPGTSDNGNTSTSGSTGGGNGGGGSSNEGGSSSSGGGSSSGSRSGGGRGSLATSGIYPTINASGCAYLTTYMKMGMENDAAEVTKLQTFLKTVELIDVDINGTFDQKTLDAVKAFQEKYVEEIMAPWGVTTPTGQVFYTTQKKINEIVCKATLALTAEQLASIEAYKKGILDGTITIGENGEIINNATGTDSLSPEVGSNDNPLTASAAGASILSRIWSFIKWLFGY